MINRTLGLAVCFAAAVGIAGCASNPPPPPAPAPAPMAAPAPPPPPAMPSNLSPAQQRVAQIQMALNANGAQLTVDGRAGPATRSALKSYQSAHKLRPTGQPDAATRKALGV